MKRRFVFLWVTILLFSLSIPALAQDVSADTLQIAEAVPGGNAQEAKAHTAENLLPTVNRTLVHTGTDDNGAKTFEVELRVSSVAYTPPQAPVPAPSTGDSGAGGTVALLGLFALAGLLALARRKSRKLMALVLALALLPFAALTGGTVQAAAGDYRVVEYFSADVLEACTFDRIVSVSNGAVELVEADGVVTGFTWDPEHITEANTLTYRMKVKDRVSEEWVGKDLVLAVGGLYYKDASGAEQFLYFPDVAIQLSGETKDSITDFTLIVRHYQWLGEAAEPILLEEEAPIDAQVGNTYYAEDYILDPPPGDLVYLDMDIGDFFKAPLGAVTIDGAQANYELALYYGEPAEVSITYEYYHIFAPGPTEGTPELTAWLEAQTMHYVEEDGMYKGLYKQDEDVPLPECFVGQTLTMADFIADADIVDALHTNVASAMGGLLGGFTPRCHYESIDDVTDYDPDMESVVLTNAGYTFKVVLTNIGTVIELPPTAE